MATIVREMQLFCLSKMFWYDQLWFGLTGFKTFPTLILCAHFLRQFLFMYSFGQTISYTKSCRRNSTAMTDEKVLKMSEFAFSYVISIVNLLTSTFSFLGNSIIKFL